MATLHVIVVLATILITFTTNHPYRLTYRDFVQYFSNVAAVFLSLIVSDREGFRDSE